MSGVKDELARRASGIKGRDAREEIAVTGEQVRGTEMIDERKPVVRLLRADEIECRVSIINERGLALLLFKDARVDQKILDETFTPFGWRRTHQSIEGNLYCTVEVWDKEKSQWIAKQDVGTTSYSEKEKGQASDSFKRACFNWGIGRELYTAPFIWITAEAVKIQKKDNKFVTSEKFSVEAISYNEQREIIELVIVNGRGCKVYEMRQSISAGQQSLSGQQNSMGQRSSAEQKSLAQRRSSAEQKNLAEQRSSMEQKNLTGQQSQTGQKAPVRQEEKKGGITDMQREALQKELERTGVPIETVLARYKIQEIGEMTADIYLKALNSLKRSKTKEAA